MQTSADKDNESPDTSGSSLSGRADRQRTAFFENPDRIETEKLGQTVIGQHFSQKSGQTPDSRQNRDNKRTVRHHTPWTESVHLKNRDIQNPDRQTPDRKYRRNPASTDIGQDFPEIPNDNETTTGHGQSADV